MTREETIDKGMKASLLLESLKPFMEEYEQTLSANWRGEKDPGIREEIWHKLSALSAFTHKLTVFKSDGEQARKELEKMNG